MKTRLLKRVRARFNWYIRKDGFPVLVDKHRRHVSVITPDHVCGKLKTTVEEVKPIIEVSMEEWVWRHMKIELFSKMGITYDPLFRTAMNHSLRGVNFKLNNEKR